MQSVFRHARPPAGTPLVVTPPVKSASLVQTSSPCAPPRSAQLRSMAKIKSGGVNETEAGGAPIGSRQGGAPDRLNETELNETGRPHRTRTERGELQRNPDLNQADNSRGSQDQTQGSQTGSDIDVAPDI